MDTRPIGAPKRHDDPDPDDLIVGTVHAPAWLRRVSPVGWLFIAMAILAAGMRLYQDGPLVGPLDLNTVNLVALTAAAVYIGAIVALPAGVMIGRPTASRRGDRLFRGAVVLALSTLFGLAWVAVAWQTRAVFIADALLETGLRESGLGTLALFGVAAQSALIIAGGGLFALGLLDRVDPTIVRAGRPVGRWLLIGAGIFASAVSFAIPVVFFGPDERATPWALADLGLHAVISAVPLVWAAIALAAVRGRASATRRPGWSLVAAGGILLLGSTLVRATMDIAGGYVASLPIDGQRLVDLNGVWYAWSAGAGVLAAVGAVLLLVGCVVGLGSVDARVVSDRAIAHPDQDPQPV